MAKYIYGPVYSWRLGRSLGIDLLSGKDKICTLNCVYCQVRGKTAYTSKRRIFVKTEDVLKEVRGLPEGVKVDYITFSGKGEPALAKNLGDVIRGLGRIRKEPIAVLTNSTLLNKKGVQKELLPADRVSCKLDAPDARLFSALNRPGKGIRFKDVTKGIRDFRKIYKGELALQVMFMDKNQRYAREIASLARDLGADAIEINTPLRKPSRGALSSGEIGRIKKYFRGFNIVSVYDRPKAFVKPIDKKATGKRRGHKNV